MREKRLKTCNKCGIIKPLSEYPKHMTWCYTCAGISPPVIKERTRKNNNKMQGAEFNNAPFVKLRPYLEKITTNRYIVKYENIDTIPIKEISRDEIWIWYKKIEVVHEAENISEFMKFNEYGRAYGYNLLQTVREYLESYHKLQYDNVGVYFCRYNPDFRIQDKKITEWIGATYCHEISIEQFMEIDFDKYFSEIDRSGIHFYKNMDYLAGIWGQIKRNSTSIWEEASKKRKNELAVEKILRKDPVQFALRYFERYAKSVTTLTSRQIIEEKLTKFLIR